MYESQTGRRIRRWHHNSRMPVSQKVVPIKSHDGATVSRWPALLPARPSPGPVHQAQPPCNSQCPQPTVDCYRRHQQGVRVSGSGTETETETHQLSCVLAPEKCDDISAALGDMASSQTVPRPSSLLPRTPYSHRPPSSSSCVKIIRVGG